MHTGLRSCCPSGSALIVGRPQSRSKYENRLAGVVGRIGWDLDEMEELGGRGADIKIALWRAKRQSVCDAEVGEKNETAVVKTVGIHLGSRRN